MRLIKTLLHKTSVIVWLKRQFREWMCDYFWMVLDPYILIDASSIHWSRLGGILLTSFRSFIDPSEGGRICGTIARSFFLMTSVYGAEVGISGLNIWVRRQLWTAGTIYRLSWMGLRSNSLQKSSAPIGNSPLMKDLRLYRLFHHVISSPKPLQLSK